MLSRAPAKSVISDWRSLTRAAQRAFREGQFSKAEDLIWESLAKAKLMGEFEPRLAISLSTLAAVQRLRGCYDRAEDLSNIALRILQVVDSRGQLKAQALINAACFFHDEGRWVEARRLYTKAIGLLELDGNDEVLADALCLQARLCVDQGRFSQAETLMNRVSILSLDDPQVVIHSLLSQAHVSIHQEKLQRAEQALLEAEGYLESGISLNQAWRSSLLSLRADLMAAQHSLAQRLSALTRQENDERYAAAIEMYERAHSIREELFGPYHFSCGKLLRKQADLYFEQGDFERCEFALRKALSATLSSHGAYHIETLRCLTRSAEVFRATDRHIEANQIEERCQQVERRVRELSRESYVVWGEPESA